MPFKVWYNNLLVECETVDDVDALSQRISSPATKQNATSGLKAFVDTGGAQSRWTEKRVKDFFELIKGGAQKKLVETLMVNPEGQTDDQLCRLLNLDGGNALGGVTSGAAKNAKKVGADPNDLFVKKRVNIDGKKVREYFLTSSFRQVASQVQK